MATIPVYPSGSGINYSTAPGALAAHNAALAYAAGCGCGCARPIARKCCNPCRTKEIEINALCRRCKPRCHKKKKHKKGERHCKRKPCCDDIEIIVISQCPRPPHSGSPQTCGIGCAALSAQLLGLISAFIPGVSAPTQAAIQAFTANATVYINCRVQGGHGNAPDVTSLNTLLGYVNATTPSRWDATAQAYAYTAYSFLNEVCVGRDCDDDNDNDSDDGCRCGCGHRRKDKCRKRRCPCC